MPSMPPATRPVLWLCVGVLVLLALLQALVVFDWERGPVRFAILLAVLAVAWLLGRRLARPLATEPARPMQRGGVGAALSLALSLVLLLVHVLVGLLSVQRTRATGEILLDQGQINVRALALIEQGVNPYGTRTMLTPHQYFQAVGGPEVRACLEGVSPRQLVARMHHFWQTRDAADMAPLYPRLSSEARCDAVRARFDAFGYAYGPALLQVYRPLWALLGDAGVYATHVLFLLGIAVALLSAARRLGGGHRGVLALPLIMTLTPTHVLVTTLVQSCADLPAVLFALLGWLALEHGHARVGGALIGVSVACKLLPGALYVPLLLGSGAVPLAVAAGTLLVLAAPYLVWDARGFWLDFVLHGFTREPDSTSLAFFLPPSAALALVASGVAVLAFVLSRELRAGLRTEGRLRWLLVAHVVALATAGNFHNNYLTWLLPVLGLFVARAFATSLAATPQAARPVSAAAAGLPDGA